MTLVEISESIVDGISYSYDIAIGVFVSPPGNESDTIVSTLTTLT
ncbi:TPA: hypothetical protein ACPZPM_001760 [Yersinia enterocolitica]